MTHVSESIDVIVAERHILPLFTDLHTLPRMLSFIEEVEPISPDVARWKLSFMGKQKQLDVRLVSAGPEGVVWTSATPGQSFDVQARTQALGPEDTRVTIDVEFDAGGMAEKLGLARPVASKAIQNELKNAKAYVERRFVR